MAQLNALQVAQYAAHAGFPASAIAQAVAYAGIESSWDTTARSSTGCIGLWQICGTSVPGDLTDPLTNAKAAYAKWSACRGGSFACDWDPYDQGSSNPNWQHYYQQAQAVASSVTAGGGSSSGGHSGAATTVTGGAGKPAPQQPGGAVAPVGVAAGSPLLPGEVLSDLNGIEQGFQVDITQTYLASLAVAGLAPAVTDVVSQAQLALSSALAALGSDRGLDQARGQLHQASGTLDQLGSTLKGRIHTMAEKLGATSSRLFTMEQKNLALFGRTAQDPRLGLSEIIAALERQGWR